MFRLVKTEQDIGVTKHHSGWPWILDHMRKHETPDGILIDDFLDRTISLPKKRMPFDYPYKEPFIGIFHHSADSPRWLKCLRDRTLDAEMASPRWRKISDHCAGFIALSDHVASQLKERTTLPVCSITHPIRDDGDQWSLAAWEKSKRVTQVGYYGRNVQAIWQLPPVAGCQYFRLKVPGHMWNSHNKSAKHRYRGRRKYYPGVTDVSTLSNTAYNKLLCSSVIIMELVTGSANNVVVECIVRGTPLLLNRYAPAVEYLGEDYPMFYDNMDHAASLITRDKLLETHEYLKAKDKTPLRVETFISDVKDFVGICR